MARSILKINGDCDINYVWGLHGTLSDEQLTSISQNGVQSPSWNSDTVLLASFKSGISADCFDDTYEIIGYKVQRKNTKENKTYLVGNFTNTQTQIEDYNVANANLYQYIVTPILKVEEHEKIGTPIATETIAASHDLWTIIDLIPTDSKNMYRADKNNMWSFNCGIKSNPLKPNYQKHYSDGFGVFPKGFYSDVDYLTGGLQAYIGDIDCGGDYSFDDVKKIEKWRKFCNTGNLKLLSTPQGLIIPCDIQDTSFEVEYDVENMPTTVSFSFIQLQDAENISVYDLGVNS